MKANMPFYVLLKSGMTKFLESVPFGTAQRCLITAKLVKNWMELFHKLILFYTIT